MCINLLETLTSISNWWIWEFKLYFLEKNFWKIKANWKFGKTEPSRIMFVLCIWFCVDVFYQCGIMGLSLSLSLSLKFLFWFLILVKSNPNWKIWGNQTHQNQFGLCGCEILGFSLGFPSFTVNLELLRREL